MADEPQSSDGPKKEIPFRFMDLPRELRNIVYSYVTVKTPLRRQQLDYFNSHPHAVLLGACQVDSRRVSRAFQIEYEEVVYLEAKLELECSFAGNWIHHCMKVGNASSMFDLLQHVEVCMPLYYNTELPEIDEAMQTAQGDLGPFLSQLPALRTLHRQYEIDHTFVDEMLDSTEHNNAHNPHRLASNAVTIRQLFTPRFTLPTQGGRNVTVTTDVIITGRLFSMQDDGDLAYTLEDRRRNYMRCRATLSTGVYAWMGMELELIDASEEYTTEDILDMEDADTAYWNGLHGAPGREDDQDAEEDDEEEEAEEEEQEEEEAEGQQ